MFWKRPGLRVFGAVIATFSVQFKPVIFVVIPCLSPDFLSHLYLLCYKKELFKKTHIVGSLGKLCNSIFKGQFTQIIKTKHF